MSFLPYDFGDFSTNAFAYGSLVAFIVIVLSQTIFAPAPPKRVVNQQKNETKPKPKNWKELALEKPKKYFTREEIAKHNTKDDCWLLIDGKVFDVTPYVLNHFGGDAIFKNAGLDNTLGFNGEQHPNKVWDIIWEFYLGELKE